jgi:hypothetical protein
MCVCVCVFCTEISAIKCSNKCIQFHRMERIFCLGFKTFILFTGQALLAYGNEVSVEINKSYNLDQVNKLNNLSRFKLNHVKLD